MSEVVWLIVQQPSGCFARFVSSGATLAETDMTPERVVCLCQSLGVSAIGAAIRLTHAREAANLWQVVNRAIDAHRANQPHQEVR